MRKTGIAHLTLNVTERDTSEVEEESIIHRDRSAVQFLYKSRGKKVSTLKAHPDGGMQGLSEAIFAQQHQVDVTVQGRAARANALARPRVGTPEREKYSFIFWKDLSKLPRYDAKILS
jgi:hypothetical protein